MRVGFIGKRSYMNFKPKNMWAILWAMKNTGYGWAMTKKYQGIKPYSIAQVVGYDLIYPIIAHKYSLLWGYRFGLQNKMMKT